MAKTKEAGAADTAEQPHFNYKELTGDEFKLYNEYLDSLGWFDKKDFELYSAEGVFKVELNDNMDKVKVLVGIKIKNDTPIHRTRIPVKTAKDLNSQIEQNTAQNTGRYYLLKQS